MKGEEKMNEKEKLVQAYVNQEEDETIVANGDLCDICALSACDACCDVFCIQSL